MGSPDLWTSELLESLSCELARVAEMTIFFGPKVYNSGRLLLCFTMIAESHISFHLDTVRGNAFVDIFTCKDIPDGLDTIVVDRLRLLTYVTRRLDRGHLP